MESKKRKKHKKSRFLSVFYPLNYTKFVFCLIASISKYIPPFVVFLPVGKLPYIERGYIRVVIFLIACDIHQ